MSIQFTAGYASMDAAPVSAYPFTFACRYRVDAAAHEAPIIGLFASTTANDWATLGIGGGKAQLRCRSSASNQVLESAAAYTQAQWRSMVGVFSSANLRTLYDNGAAAVTQTTAVTPAGLNRFGFGRYLDSTPSGSFTGYASMLVMWNVELTAQEAAAYISGIDPWMIRPQAIVGIWDGQCSNVGRDLRGQREPTFTNAVYAATDGRQFPQYEVIVPPLKPPIPAAAGLFIANDTTVVETRVPVELTPGKGQLFDWTIDPTTRTAKVRVNGGAWQSAGYQDVLKAVQGNAVIGLPLVDGVPTGSSNNFILNSLVAFSRQLTDTEWDTVHGEMGKMIPPIVPNVTVNATVGHVSDLSLLDDAQDAAGEGLKIVSVTQPAGAAVTIKDADAGIVSYDAKTLPTGTKNSFGFTVTNKFFKPTTATATCNVTVAALQPPVLEVATLTPNTTVGTAATLDVLANATDPAGRALTIASVTTPTQGGTAAIDNDKIKYTPKAGFTGTDTFKYKIKNDWGAEVEGSVSVTVAAASSGKALAIYRTVGCNMYACTQGDGDSGNHKGQIYRLTAALDAPVECVVLLSQGARQFFDQGDTHAHGNSGNYSVKLCGVTSGNLIDTGKLKASAAAQVYPGKQLAKNGVAGFDAWNPVDPPVGNGNYKISGAELISGLQSLNITGATPPEGYGDNTWRSVARISMAGYHRIQLYDGSGTDTSKRYTATKGEVLCVQNKNENDSPTTNYAHDNEGMSAGAPKPSAGATVPFDPNLTSFGMGDNAEEPRRTPFILLGYRVDGKLKYYGNPWYYQNVKLKSWTATSDVAWRILYGKRAVRQILTPPDGYEGEVMANLSVHAWRYAGISGYTGAGSLQVRVRRATLGSQSFSDYWPSSGWQSFAANTFKYVDLDAAGTDGQTSAFTNYGSSAAGTFETYLKKSEAEGHSGKGFINFGRLSLPNTFKIESGYHYAVELRAQYDTTSSPNVKCCYVIQPIAHLYYAMDSFPSGVDDIRPDCPQVWKPGSFNSSKPREYHCIEECADITASSPSWSLRTNGVSDILPVCFLTPPD